MKNVLLIVLSFLFCSCTQQQKYNKKTFHISVLKLKRETQILAAMKFKSKIYCLEDSGRIFTIDSNYQIVPISSDDSERLPRFDNILLYRDTLLFISPLACYTVNESGKIIYTNKPAPYWGYNSLLLSDEKYNVYACSNGEWGGSVTFIDRATERTFSYPIPEPLAALNNSGKYYLFSGFKNDIFILKDPKMLFANLDSGNNRPCDIFTEMNYYFLPDSLNNKLNVIHQRFGDSSMGIVCPFFYKDQLYAIGANEKQTFIYQLKDGKTEIVDTVFNKPIIFQSAIVYSNSNDPTLATYYDNTITEENGIEKARTKSTGLIMVSGNEIKVIEFDTSNNR